MVHKKIIDYVGDPPEIKNLLKNVNYSLNEEQAQKLVDLICEYMEWPKYRVIFSKRETKSICATCDIDNRVIKVYKQFGTVQTVIHEITHHLSFKHDSLFKNLQLELAKLYKTRFREIIINERTSLK